jgi:hypothetical protein
MRSPEKQALVSLLNVDRLPRAPWLERAGQELKRYARISWSRAKLRWRVMGCRNSCSSAEETKATESEGSEAGTSPSLRPGRLSASHSSTSTTIQE